MAWYAMTYSCGHTDREQLYGPTAGRESYVDWAARNKVCRECWEAQRTKQREDRIATEKAECARLRESLIAQGVDLPELTGSDKQIAWANDIRAKLLSGKIGWAVANCAKDNKHARQAKWWIDRRGRDESVWALYALPSKWAWADDFGDTSDDPRRGWATDVIKDACAGARDIAECVIRLTKLATEIVNPDHRPDAETKTGECQRWLVVRWVQTGLIEWLQKRIALKDHEHRAALEQAKDSDATARELAVASEEASKARQLRREATADLAEARAAREKAEGELAKQEHIAERAREALSDSERAALMVGNRALIAGREWTLTEVLDGGLRVYAVDRDAGQGMEFVRADWVAGHQIYEIAQQGGR